MLSPGGTAPRLISTRCGAEQHLVDEGRLLRAHPAVLPNPAVIEPLAGAGGICISMDVERQIRSAIEVSPDKLAPTELKNIQAPMELFRVSVAVGEGGANQERVGAHPRGI